MISFKILPLGSYTLSAALFPVLVKLLEYFRLTVSRMKFVFFKMLPFTRGTESHNEPYQANRVGRETLERFLRSKIALYKSHDDMAHSHDKGFMCLRLMVCPGGMNVLCCHLLSKKQIIILTLYFAILAFFLAMLS